MMQRDGHSTYLKITDTDMGDIVAGSKWCVYEKEPRRDPKIKVDWFGEEGSEDRAYGQWIMEEFYRRRLERMKGPHCRRSLCPSEIQVGTGLMAFSARYLLRESNTSSPWCWQPIGTMGCKAHR